MEITILTLLFLILLIIILCILYQIYRFYNPYFPYDEKMNNCQWSRWGCCKDKITPKYDQQGTNCRGWYYKKPQNPDKEKCDD